MHTHSSPVEMDQEQTQRLQITRTVIQVSLIATSILTIIFSILWVVAPQFTGRYVAVALLVFVVFSGISLWLVRRQQLGWAVALYIVGMIVGLTVSIYFLGGITGPLAASFIMVAVITGLIGGPRALRYVSVAIGAIFLTMVVLEATQVLHPPRVPDAISWLMEGVLYLSVFAVAALVAGTFISQTERAIDAERQRELELSQASRQAEELAMVEREARERETRAVAHIRETVAGYVDYLSRVAAGEYTARVDVGELDKDVEGDRELHALGEYLNTTVEALVAALTQSQEVQRRYTEQSWQTVVASGRAQPGFAYRQNQITPEAEWLPQMVRAVDSGAPVTEGEGAGVPLVINRQVVGAIGGQHPDGRPWTAEELSLIENVTGQLAQTIESLRLFDDVQRRAAREQILAQVTARMRESLDMETVLRTAVAEMRQALELEGVVVQLARPAETAPVADEVGTQGPAV